MNKLLSMLVLSIALALVGYYAEEENGFFRYRG